MSEHYFPSNGTEGEYFMSMWCEHCTKDTMLRGGKTYCSILTGSMVNPPPVKQWIYKDGKPTCTSFKRIGQSKKEKPMGFYHNGKKLSELEVELLGFKTKLL